MKRNLLSLASISLMLTALFSGCSKEPLVEKDALSEKIAANKDVSLLAAGQGPYDVLGHGYNVTGEYGNEISAGFAVIDVDKFKQAQAARLVEESPRSQEYLEEYGENALQYSRMMSRKIQATTGFAFFKSTITTNFNSSEAFDAKYIYGSYNLTIKQKRYRFNAAADLLRNYLTSTFIADLQAQTPQQLVQRYGTHVLIDVYTGAKLDIMFQAETKNQNRQTAARAGIKVGVSTVFDLNVNDSTNVIEANQNYSRKLSYRTRGADPSRALMGEINLDVSTPKISISSWQGSSTVENSVFVDIGQYGLILLYDLIADPTKKAAVKSYIDQYLRDNQVNLKYNAKPIYVMYSQRDNNHVYTHDLNDYPYQQGGFANLGINFYAFNYPANGALPVHVFYHPTQKNHVYTINRNDYPYEQNGFIYHGVNFYAFTQQVAGSSPVHVFYSPSGHDHVYTINRNDYPYEQNGFQYQGVNFYAFKNSTPF